MTSSFVNRTVATGIVIVFAALMPIMAVNAQDTDNPDTDYVPEGQVIDENAVEERVNTLRSRAEARLQQAEDRASDRADAAEDRLQDRLDRCEERKDRIAEKMDTLQGRGVAFGQKIDSFTTRLANFVEENKIKYALRFCAAPPNFQTIANDTQLISLPLYFAERAEEILRS